jgi:RNA polymerase sigma-70 factor (ECF subfamily)
MDDATARQLLLRVAAGDEAAFDRLYRAHSRRVYAYVLNLLKDPSRAEEVLVDAMHEVWRSAGRFRGDARFSTWLLGIARNKALLVYRNRRADEDHGDLDEVAETLAADDDADGFAQLAQKQRREGVRECMGKLTEEHRECLHLVFYEGYSIEDVAALQSVPENTVKTRLFHARQKMRNCLRLLLEREGADVGESE